MHLYSKSLCTDYGKAITTEPCKIKKSVIGRVCALVEKPGKS